MPDYVREQSVGELLRNGANIYRRNFLGVFATYFLVCFPTTWLYVDAVDRGSLGLGYSLAALNVLIGCVATGALTILVSDMCVGNTINVGRAYKSLGIARAAKVLGTSFLVVTGFLAPLILVLVIYSLFPTKPILVLTAGVIAAVVVVYLFASLLAVVPIVVLEDRGGMAAIKRSWSLAGGLRGRNLQLFGLLLILSFAFGLLVGALSSFASETISERALNALALLVQFLLVPLIMVVIVLMYYDSRVRHEGYDTHALGEDLHH